MYDILALQAHQVQASCCRRNAATRCNSRLPWCLLKLRINRAGLHSLLPTATNLCTATVSTVCSNCEQQLRHRCVPYQCCSSRARTPWITCRATPGLQPEQEQWRSWTRSAVPVRCPTRTCYIRRHWTGPQSTKAYSQPRENGTTRQRRRVHRGPGDGRARTVNSFVDPCAGRGDVALPWHILGKDVLLCDVSSRALEWRA